MKIKIFALGALAAASITGTASALTLDGIVSDLGAAAASDPTTPWTAPGDEGGAGNNQNLDLQDLYVAESGGIIHIAMTVDTPFTATVNDWGKYKIYIQTDNGGVGNTTSDPWGRAIRAGGSFSPQYVLSAWVDGGGGSQFHHWNTGTSAWDVVGAGSSFAFSNSGNGGNAGVEWSVTRAALGNPATIQVQGTDTGGGGSDNGQDAVPSQTNATDWSTVTVLATPTSAAAVPVTISGFSVE
ncbi:MAG: hypothetical protein ACR2IE_03250 [Candidatus Sumerlaeaceae bacterium]